VSDREQRRFLLPDLGEGLTEAEIVAWHVEAGDEVELNQVLVEVETEKAVVELPSPYAGTVVELLAAPGETVAVGAPLVAIDAPGAGPTEPDTTAADPADPAVADGAAAVEAVAGRPEERVSVLVGYGPNEAAPSRRRRRRGSHPEPPANGPSHPRTAGRPMAAPPVRFMARQEGVDLGEVEGHGPGGIITREDLAAHLAGATTLPDATSLAAAPVPGRETRAPVRGIQKHMAEAMVRSVATAPQACVFLTLDVTASTELIERLRQNRHFEGAHVTMLTLAARAVLLALRDHAALNSSWDEATAEVVTKHYVNLGIAVAGPHGLVVPNIKDAQDLTLRDLAAALSDLTARARAARSTTADLSGGTFTITNVGVFGVDAGVPLLNPGEAAIVALGAVQRRPWEHDGDVALRDVVTLSLAFDHRLVDGQGAAHFLAAVGEILSDPTNLIALV
jgi:pyruvate dehydrogenase E2 component (dihydrolipoamide acetyltransferase)